MLKIRTRSCPSTMRVPSYVRLVCYVLYVSFNWYNNNRMCLWHNLCTLELQIYSLYQWIIFLATKFNHEMHYITKIFCCYTYVPVRTREATPCINSKNNIPSNWRSFSHRRSLRTCLKWSKNS